MRQNKQRPEVKLYREDGSLEVHSVFLTIQGEGPLAGRKAVFVRLAGCNLQCPGCDTEYTSRRMLADPASIGRMLGEDGMKAPLVVVTGGEPFRQNLVPLADQLAGRDIHMQVETNGVVYDPALDPYIKSGFVSLVVSPKVATMRIPLELVSALKYVLGADVLCRDGLPLHALRNNSPVYHPPADYPRHKIYLQPEDHGEATKNEAAKERVLGHCFTYNYRLSLQQHKLLGLE